MLRSHHKKSVHEITKAKALFLGERIDTRALDRVEKLSTMPLTLEVNENGFAVLFKYGVVVLFDVTALEEARFLNNLENLIAQKHPKPESETLDIRLDGDGHERFENNVIFIEQHSLDRLQLIADIMAKSVVLDYFEATLDKILEQLEPITSNLEKNGLVGLSSKEILRHIGGTLLNEHKMIARVRVMEKPDVLWEKPQLERLYSRLEKEFEIRERSATQERKLQLIGRTAQTILDLNQNRHALRVEWYIVGLIVVEVCIEMLKLIAGGLN